MSEVTVESVRKNTPYRVAGGSDFDAGDIVYLIYDDDTDCPKFSKDPSAGRYDSGTWYVSLCRLKLVEEIKETKGEGKMTNEEVKRPEYIIITRNTEVFKKGGVFKYYGSFYAPADAEQAYTVRPYGDDYIRDELADLLLEKKVAVEAVKFSPGLVTLEQNEALGKALEGMKTKKTVKRAPVKRTTTKKA